VAALEATGSPFRLLVVTSPGTEATVDDLYRRLHDVGLELVFAAGRRGHRIPAKLLELPRVSVVDVPLERTGKSAKTIRTFRHAANLVRFLDPHMDGGSWTRDAQMRTVLEKLKHPTPDAPVSVELPEPVWKRLTTLMRNLERELSPHPELESALREIRADGVMLVSRIGRNSIELDVLKVARRLQIPSVLLVWSWDNLTSKAVLNEHPDHMLVWNDIMASEAHVYHGVDPSRIRLVGAPLFDRFFELAEATPDTRQEEPTLLYLGSSPYASDDESAICDDWIAAIRGSSDRALAAARIEVRPHPADDVWEAWKPPDDRVTLHASHRGEGPMLLDLIRGASVVVGLNTSGEIEAAIAGRPVATFRVGKSADGQEGALHFPYLLEANGGFVIDAGGLDEHVAQLSRLLRGDWDPEPTRRFLERFLRPAGLSQPACLVAADTVIEVLDDSQTRRVPCSARAPADHHT
jgi:hypothetical protein